MWQTDSLAGQLDADTLSALLANKLPAIRIEGFASEAECQAFTAATRRFAMRPVVGDTEVGQPAFAAQRIDHLGMTQAEYKRRGRDAYLTAAKAATEEVGQVFSLSFDPVARLADHLRPCVAGPIGIAHEPDGRPYFCGIIRSSNQGLALHADFAPYQARKLAIDRVEAQLAWNFYAEVPAEGGDTILHNAPWTWTPSHADEIADNYPLPRRLVEGARSFRYHPKAGEAWLVNTRNPHEVEPIRSTECDRVAVACFIGRMPDGSLVMWS
jgi:hypothetical protein